MYQYIYRLLQPLLWTTNCVMQLPDIVVTPKFVRTVKSYTNFSNAARF